MEVQRENFDFAAVVDEVLAQLRPRAEGEGLRLPADLAPALRLQGDRRKVFQVLPNLVNNALKFTLQGSVTVCAEAVDGRLRVAVIDTGVGIAEDQRSLLLFQAFRQLDGSLGRKHEGTGLGPYLSRKLLDLCRSRSMPTAAPAKAPTCDSRCR